ncbi:MAG: NAD(P)H-dependent oxidoreductase subunit E [bacterium]|nr:NAD(P)H-dependent oxidoreductase subunit E [bacterium]
MAELKTSVDFRKIDEILNEFGYDKSNLITILQKVQGVYRYLSEDAIEYIGNKIDGLSPATVWGVATFYAQFSLEPKGKYEIKICDGTACHVRGSMPVLHAVAKKLDLRKGKITTDNGLFSLETVSCLGACSLAPAIVINDKVYPKMTPEAALIIIDTLLKENE